MALVSFVIQLAVDWKYVLSTSQLTWLADVLVAETEISKMY